MSRKTKILQLLYERDRGGGPGQRRYRIEQLVNSVEYHPGEDNPAGRAASEPSCKASVQLAFI
jgi:hypothetical protein